MEAQKTRENAVIDYFDWNVLAKTTKALVALHYVPSSLW